jgi:membrane protease YdiL (CAAX protease family)
MQMPSPLSILFLAYLLVLLPWMAIRSATVVRAVREGTSTHQLPSREGIWLQTILTLAFLFALAWYTGRSFGFRIFALPPVGAREIAASLGALTAYFGLRVVARAVRSEEERRRMVVYFIAPRQPREWLLWGGTVVAASIAEEAAYRGVGMSILWFATGNPYFAATVCAVAFALAHWTQGWKSAAVIFAMALVMHGLVAFTGTLVLAMLVHGVYDFVAGYLIARQAAEYDREAASHAAPSTALPD